LLDFTEIGTGNDFELFCEDLLTCKGFTILERVSRGKDRGKDIIAEIKQKDPIGITQTFRVLVECKHKAESNNSVYERDLGNIILRTILHQCNRYLLITSTMAASTVQNQLEGINSNSSIPICANCWNKSDLTTFVFQYPKLLNKHLKKHFINHITNHNELDNVGVRFINDTVTITFDKTNLRYGFLFRKKYKILNDGLFKFRAQFYANKILGYEKASKDYYEENPIVWDDLSVKASLKYKKNTDAKFILIKELQIENYSGKKSYIPYIPFDILYNSKDGNSINLPAKTTVIMEYSYSVPTILWGNYMNRSSTSNKEQLVLNLMHSGELDNIRIYELQNDLDAIPSLAGKPVEVKDIVHNKMITSKFDESSGLTITKIRLPPKCNGRWRIFWDAEKYYENDFNSASEERDLLYETTW